MISNIFNIFQELYVRKGITPKYDLVQIEGAVHEPTFKYRVTVGDAVATGKRRISNKQYTKTTDHRKNLGLGIYIFVCSCFLSLGCGASKKKAKHEAAKNILTKLKAAQKHANATSNAIEHRNTHPVEISNKIHTVNKVAAAAAVVNVQLPNLDTDLMSPYDDGISGNPVGELQVTVELG